MRVVHRETNRVIDVARMSTGYYYDGKTWYSPHEVWEMSEAMVVPLQLPPERNQMIFRTKTSQEEVVDLSKITNMWKYGGGQIKAMLTSGDTTHLSYSNSEDRDKDYSAMTDLMAQNQQNVQGEPMVQSSGNNESFLKSVVGDTRAFIAEHKNIIYTIAILFLVDHFIFDGGFRNKLKSLMDKMINKVESKIDGP